MRCLSDMGHSWSSLGRMIVLLWWYLVAPAKYRKFSARCADDPHPRATRQATSGASGDPTAEVGAVVSGSDHANLWSEGRSAGHPPGGTES